MSEGHTLQIEADGNHGGTCIPARPGSLLTDLLRRAHFPLNTRCGGRGLCEGCKIELTGGEMEHTTSVLAIGPGEHLACQCRTTGHPASIRIPARSLLAHKPQVVGEFRINVPRARDPLCQFVEIEAQGSVARALATAAPGHMTRLAPHIEDKQSGRLFVRLEYRGDHWLATDIVSSPPPRLLGAAIDVGTTTVALVLVDLLTGTITGRASGFNKQTHLGDDVATRIGLCLYDKSMVGVLRDAVMRDTVGELLAAANPSGEPLACLCIAGNTIMQHLAAGIDPSPMGTYPFAPTFLGHRVFGSPAIHLLPSAAAYIGADVVAGLLASGMAYDPQPALLVDVGTNGEIVLQRDGRLVGCATAAGPAFEGAGLSHGMRAAAGAIERIRIHTNPFRVEISVIGHGTPIGICGSAYIDFLAAGRSCGLLTASGRFDPSAVPDAGQDLLEIPERGKALRIGRTRDNNDIFISESDMAHLLQAKAAIAAGIATLLERENISQTEIRRVYLAGGFGMHLDVANTIACGLLPGFSPPQIQVVGNTALAGAYLAVLDASALREMDRIATRLESLELNLDPGFEERFIDHLSLPDQPFSPTPIN